MKPEIQQAVHGGKIGLSHAIEINKFPISNQLETLEATINEGLSTSKLKRMRSQSLPEVVTKVASRLSEKELEEVAIQSEYRRFQKFLLNQVDAHATPMVGREEVAADWICALDALRTAYSWRLPTITERINTLMVTILSARTNLEDESDESMAPNEHLTNRAMLAAADLRRDKPPRRMLAWLTRENARFQALSCNHSWSTRGDHCRLCGISRHTNLYWVDPPSEPPSTRGEAQP
jgi:hypothetical protein